MLKSGIYILTDKNGGEMSKWFTNELIQNQLKEVKTNMANNLKSGNNYLNGSLDYLLLSSGKMLRPAMLLIGSHFGKEKDKSSDLIELATALETLHVATLLHDDVIDDADKRRGQESIQSKYSKDYAIYMGDYLLSKCFLLLTELQIPKDLAVALAKVVSRICLGEISQYSHKYDTNITPMGYLRIVSGKTAALFAIALSAGAYITKSNKKTIKRLAHAGYQLGMSFQIVDDLLDFTGDEITVGKNLKSDLLRGYYSMPVIFALRDDSKYKQEINDLFKKGITKDNVNNIIELIKKSGAIDKTRTLAIRYNNRSITVINRLPESSAKRELLDIVPKLLERLY
ncbi:MAG: polyprenyl synthetase family protein [Spirochaetaceae bacterium]